MKKIYLFLGLSAITGQVFSQQTSNKFVEKKSALKETTMAFDRSSKPTSNSAETDFQQKVVLYSEDFESVTPPSLPAGMTATTLADPVNYSGWYTGNSAAANAGGFWPVPAHTNFAMTNDDVADDNLCSEILILPELDFAGQTDMILKMDVFHDKNYGSGDGKVMISTDLGVNWVDLIVLPVDAANWQSLVINLSAYDGLSNITIGIYWNDGTDPSTCDPAFDNWGTGLAVDNIVVENAPLNDLAGNWLIPADISTDYEYTIIPLTQARPVGATMSISNNGTAVQNDASFNFDVAFNATPVGSGASATSTINSFSLDTLTAVSTYTPTGVGAVTLTASTSMGAMDENTSNDTAESSFQVSENTWARDNTTFDGGIYNIGNGSGGASLAPFGIGHLFFVTEDQIFNTIDIGVRNNTGADGAVFFGQILMWDGANWIELERTIEYDFYTAADGGTIVSLPLLSPVQVTAGMELLVLANHYGGVATDGSDQIRFATAGVSREQTVLGTSDNDLTGVFYLTSPPSPVVRLVYNPTLNLDENQSLTGVTVYPNPAKDVVNVNYTLENNSDVKITIADLSGKVVFTTTEENVAAGKHLVAVPTAKFANGVYTYSFTAGNAVVTEKLVINK